MHCLHYHWLLNEGGTTEVACGLEEARQRVPEFLVFSLVSMGEL